MPKPKKQFDASLTDAWMQQFITCFIDRDVTGIGQLIKQSPDTRLKAEARVFREYFRLDALEITEEAAFKMLRPFLENTPLPEDDMRACMLLSIGADLAAIVGQKEQSQHWLRQLELRIHRVPLDLRAACLYIKANVCGVIRERATAINVLNEALTHLKGRPATLLWYRTVYKRAILSMLLGRIEAVQNDIALLRKHPQFDHLTPNSVDGVELQLCIIRHDFPRGFELLGKLSSNGNVARLEVWLLIMSGELDRARLKIDQMRNTPQMDEESYLYFRGLIYLVNNQPGRAVQFARRSMDAIQPAKPQSLILARLLLLEAALVQRDAIGARHRLENMEIDLERYQFLGYAIRLSLLEGRKEQAVRELREFLAEQPAELLMARLRYAHELSVDDLAVIWGWAKDTPRPDSKVQNAINLQAAMGGTQQRILTRRKKLEELFTLYDRLARGDIAKMTGCGLRTAAKDLIALENEGVIRRVETSGHPRTGYYERIVSENA